MHVEFAFGRVVVRCWTWRNPRASIRMATCMQESFKGQNRELRELYLAIVDDQVISCEKQDL